MEKGNKVPTCKEDLWTKENGASSQHADIFVNFNRYSKPFIRAKGKAFDFTNKGFRLAVKYLMDAKDG